MCTLQDGNPFDFCLYWLSLCELSIIKRLTGWLQFCQVCLLTFRIISLPRIPPWCVHLHHHSRDDGKLPSGRLYESIKKKNVWNAGILHAVPLAQLNVKLQFNSERDVTVTVRASMRTSPILQARKGIRKKSCNNSCVLFLFHSSSVSLGLAQSLLQPIHSNS